MLKREKDVDLRLLFIISFVSILVFGTLTIIKFNYANALDSQSLYKDGICSLIGTCLSASLLLTTAIIERAPNAWYIDPIVSIVIGVSATVYGFRVIIRLLNDGVPLFHKDFWVSKKESEQATQELPDVEKSASGDYEGGTASEEAEKAANEEHEVI